jgi:hypothetical protein
MKHLVASFVVAMALCSLAFLFRRAQAAAQQRAALAAAAEAKPDRRPIPGILLASKGHWDIVYANATPEQIHDEVEGLRVYLNEETREYYRKQFAAGNYEIVNDRRADGSYGLNFGDDLAAWRILPTHELAKVTLPRQGFEKAYEAKYRMQWLLSAEQDKFASAAEAR